MFYKLFSRLAIPASKVSFALSSFIIGHYLTQKSFNIQCLQTVRVNKPQFIKLINSTKEEVLILIYNRQSEDSLESQILKFQEEAEKLKIDKLALVDHTDLRHLQTFAKIIRDDFEQNKQETTPEPRNLQGKIKIMYINPTFDTTKPFIIKQQNQLKQQIEEIRKFIVSNPTEQQLKRSLKTFNRTTVVKNCYNQTCIQQYKQKVRRLIEVELLRDKLQNFGFYYTSSKSDATKISNLINQSSNKQEIYVFRNDLLGSDRQLETVFDEQQGNKYSSLNKFMMLIRPRVHILSKAALNTDLYWYISCTKLTQAPTFSINNTKNNLPVRIIDDENITSGKQNEVAWLKGHYREVELIKKIKQRYGRKLQVLIVQTTLPSELFRHLYQPQRYCIFSLGKQVPYPKLFIRPSTLTINIKNYRKVVKVEQNEQHTQAAAFINTDKQTEDYSQKWNRIIQKIDKFVQKPLNYSQVKIYKEKEIEINGEQLLKKLKNQNGQRYNDQKWVFRICGAKHSCFYSAYEKYGLELSVPVYTLDSEVQNISINEGDYLVQNGSVNLLN